MILVNIWNYQNLIINGDNAYYNTHIEGVDLTESGVIADYHLVANQDTHSAFTGE